MILVLDTETTGLPKNYKAPVTDTENWPRLVQIAWRTYENNGEEIDINEYIILPKGFDIPDDAAKLHGITTQRAIDDGISLESALLSLAFDIADADYIVAHNIAYDEKVIGAEFVRTGLSNPLKEKATICTMLSSVKFCAIPGPRGNKWPRLGELYQVLFAENLEGEHNAAVDCEAAARCFWKLVEKGVIVLKSDEVSVDEMFPAVANIAEKVDVVQPTEEINEGIGKEIAISDELREELHLEGVKVVVVSDEETNRIVEQLKREIQASDCAEYDGPYINKLSQPVSDMPEWIEKEIAINDDLRKELQLEGVKVVEMTDEETRREIQYLEEIAIDAIAEEKEKERQELSDFDPAEILTPLQLQSLIMEAYTDLKQSRFLLHRVGNRIRRATEILEAKKTALVNGGQINGANDTQRKAQMAEMTAEETAQLRTVEQEEHEVRFDFDQDSATVEMVRALLRVAEMASGGRVGER